MILTEEQRAALKRVVAYMDEMYAIASPYHGCTEDANILRAMIDGSGTVEPVGGFDLEKARAMICHYRIENPGDADTDCGLEDLIRQANLAEEALDEIERLNAHINSACIESLRIAEEQAAEIERLRKALDESERVVAHKTKSAAHWYDEHLQARADRVQTRRVVEQQAARIKALEDALVEERVIGEGGFRAEQCEFWYIEDLPEESCMELDGPCDWAKCPRKHELCDVAYQQLAEEGKIGPDDSKKISHLRPYEVVAADLAGMLAKSWQITDERKAAIKELSELLTAIGCPSCHYYIQKNYGENITVLRAMLTEVG